jgi:hypothetical protein
MGWLYECGEIALDAVADMSARHGISILAGTLPFAAGHKDGTPTYLNRAWLLTPEGARHAQVALQFMVKRSM